MSFLNKPKIVYILYELRIDLAFAPDSAEYGNCKFITIHLSDLNETGPVTVRTCWLVNVKSCLYECLIVFLLTLEASDHLQLSFYLCKLFGFWRRRVDQRRHTAELGSSDTRSGKFTLIYFVSQG